MTKYRLNKTCMRGRKGEVVEVKADDVAPLKLNNVIGEPVREPEVQKVVEPTVQKVVEPTVKKRGRRARNATN